MTGVTVRLERRYARAEDAERLERALAPDQGTFVRCERDGVRLAFVVESESPAKARATVDDLLACLGSAERTLGITTAAR